MACASFHAVLRNRHNKIHLRDHPSWRSFGVSNFPVRHVYQILFWGMLVLQMILLRMLFMQLLNRNHILQTIAI